MQEIVLVKSGQDGLSVRVAYKGKITYQFVITGAENQKEWIKLALLPVSLQ
ncbi:hypothetical protein [Budvicia aquatica]|uniref:Uncharacterized protein n=1 Tax=Budvicia aquatica TaxID=82979 RepID=A0A484ZID8_9GAMM|nr:hypothetical protein [Budvicia aquatica]VFS47768.1 Uncharacterised protein [Budvicia aquatica]